LIIAPIIFNRSRKHIPGEYKAVKQAAVLFMLIALAAPAIAQDGSASMGTTGSAFSNGPTGWQAQQDTALIPAAPLGQTFPTYDSILGNGAPGPMLAPAQSGGIANNSVNQAAVDSGYYSFGFPQSSASSTTDPYVPPGLPLTSSGSVDLNTADCPYCGQGVSTWGW
jgi:hypothetical protein